MAWTVGTASERGDTIASNRIFGNLELYLSKVLQLSPKFYFEQTNGAQ
jgi:hypothetical protein